MPNQIFVNLPVKDLQKSIDFFTKVGFTFNPQFTDETATCMVISDTIFAMLVTEKRFTDFTKKPISDAKKSTEVILALGVSSREEVDGYTQRAMEAGGSESMPMQDYGWMYLKSFQDLDGHMWEVAYMDMSKMPQE